MGYSHNYQISSRLQALPLQAAASARQSWEGQMRLCLRRREFIAGLSGSAVWPLAARAQQQPAVPVVGYLDPGSPETGASAVATFRKGLSETGFVEGLNVAIEYRWARNDSAKLPALAADLVRRRVAVIVALGTAGSLAAKAATNTIPIVFTTGADAVQAGLVRSYNSPGGNVTGFSSMSSEVGPKQLELLAGSRALRGARRSQRSAT